MRLSKKYGGIQFFSPAPGRLQINFDSHVISVSGALYNGVVQTITTSGAAITGAANNGVEYIFDVILENGYIIDTVVLSNSDNVYGELTSKTDTSFGITAGTGGIDQTITITSKQGGSTMSKSVDLTVLSGWANLTDGTHNITVVAKATGYADSDPSAAVTVTKGSTGETDITSTVSAFNISLQLNSKESVNLQSTLGGGNGTYAATIEDTSVATPTVDGTTLNVYSDTTSSATTKVVVTSGSKSLSIPVNVEYQLCLTADTLITMYDGTTKRIDQIELGDNVLSLDKDGNKVPGYVYYCDSHCNHMGKHYDRFVFEDGTELKIVHRHRFYNMNEKKFVHLDLWYPGDEAYKLDGTTTALKETHLRDYEGDIPHYTLFCEHNTYFANGLLCGNRFSDPVDFNKGISTFANTTYEDSAIVLTLPETFEGYEDAWLDANTLDLMLKKDGQTINYYQVGYANTYGAIYKKPSDDAATDYDTIISSWEKICDIPTSEGSNCVDGKTFDVVIIYAKRPSRSDGIAVQSLDGGGSQCSAVSLQSQSTESESVSTALSGGASSLQSKLMAFSFIPTMTM